MTGRPIEVVHVTPDFRRSFARLPVHLQRLAERKDQWFRADTFDPRLRTHQLKGPLAGFWAYSVNQQYRVLFLFVSPNAAMYYDIGTHDIYR